MDPEKERIWSATACRDTEQPRETRISVRRDVAFMERAGELLPVPDLLEVAEPNLVFISVVHVRASGAAIEDKPLVERPTRNMHTSKPKASGTDRNHCFRGPGTATRRCPSFSVPLELHG